MCLHPASSWTLGPPWSASHKVPSARLIFSCLPLGLQEWVTVSHAHQTFLLSTYFPEPRLSLRKLLPLASSPTRAPYLLDNSSFCRLCPSATVRIFSDNLSGGGVLWWALWLLLCGFAEHALTTLTPSSQVVLKGQEGTELPLPSPPLLLTAVPGSGLGQ